MNIPLFCVQMPLSVDEPLLKVLHSGYVGQGPKAKEFEERLKLWTDNDYILSLNTGTSGLHLALKLAGVNSRSEVISTPMTCTATNLPILHTGARIRWADINPWTGNIDPETIPPLITQKTKAIVCVHWGGYPCELDEIHKIASEYGLAVIEDAAHAFGAEYKDRMIGSISDYTMFSFQAIKHITTIDGGALSVKNEKDYERGKLLRWYGIDREDKSKCDMRCEADIKEAGFKWHMNDVCATIGIEQLKRGMSTMGKFRNNAAYYRGELKRRKIKSVLPLRYKNDRYPSYWLFTVRADDRAAFLRFMNGVGVQVSQVHSRNDTHSCFKRFKERELPGVDEFTNHQCSIPVYAGLAEWQRSFIINAIQEFDRLGRA